MKQINNTHEKTIFSALDPTLRNISEYPDVSRRPRPPPYLIPVDPRTLDITELSWPSNSIKGKTDAYTYSKYQINY